jgi:hypothetical protein
MPIFRSRSGSFQALQVTGSDLTTISSSIYFRNLTTSSQAYVLTYNDTTGQIFYTASSAAGQGGTITSVNQGDGIAVTNPSGPSVTVNLNTSSAHFIGGISKLTGSLLLTSSFNTWTGSNTSQFSGTASYVTGSIFTSTNPALSSSYALSASRAITASLATTASYVTGSIFTSTNPALSASNALTASFVATASYVTGSIFTSTNLALSASNALTASFVATASYVAGSIFTNTNPVLSASYALTASHALNAAATVNTGSLLTTASVSLNTITFTKGDGSTFPITVNTGSGGSGGDFVPSSWTGSAASVFSGTASYVTGSIFTSTNPALSASYAETAITSSKVLILSGSINGLTYIYGGLEGSGSTGIDRNVHTTNLTYNTNTRLLNASSSFALTASYVTGSIFASTNPALSASYALTASQALTASYVNGIALIGTSSAYAQYTTAKITTVSGLNTIYSIRTASYDGAFFEYTLISGTNARAGQIMSIWSGSNIRYTETTTTDIGSTSNFIFSVVLTAGSASLQVTGSTGAVIKTIIKSI